MKIIMLWIALGLPTSQLIFGEEGVYTPILKDHSEWCLEVEYGIGEGFVTDESNMKKCFYGFIY